MPKKQGVKKPRFRLGQEAQEKISASALEHPELGARRLSRFLRNEGVEVSEGSVRNALQKLKLHTRELRLKHLEERLLNNDIGLSDEQRRALHEFNPCLRERTVESRMPGLLLIQDVIDLGALNNIGRIYLHAAVDPSCCLAFAVLNVSTETVNDISVLSDQAIPLYQQNNIPLQAVIAGSGLDPSDGAYLGYLKSQGISLAQLPPGSGRNGFVERFEGWVRKDFLEKHLRDRAPTGLEELKAGFDDWLERYNHSTPLPGYPTMGRPAMEVFRTAVRPAAGKGLEPEVPDAAATIRPPLKAADLPPPLLGRRLDRGADRAVWVFRALNGVLACLVAYFGWSLWLQLVGIGRQPPELAALEGPQTATPEQGTSGIETPPQSEPVPGDYRVIWGRNLFGVSAAGSPPARPKKEVVETIALASRDIGLKLIGTVAADDPKRSLAIIDVAASRDQGIFRERDRVGKAVILTILRNTVIIETEDGERRRLSVNEDPPKNSAVPLPVIARPAEVAAAPPPAENVPAGDGTHQVSRDEVATSFSDAARVIEESVITSPVNELNPNGFYLGRLRAADVLYRIGMRTGDVVKGVDGQEYGGPEDAESFLQRLAQGGHLSVMIERRGQPLKLDVLIE